MPASSALPDAAALTLEQAVGQLICPTLFVGDAPYDEPAVLAAQARWGWGGYILFHGRRDETARRVAALQAASPIPLLVAADMEHGAGQQIAELSAFPPAMAFGATGDPGLARALGAWTAREAAGVGVNWILAPVADVTNNPLNPIINIRAFGGDPGRVAACVAAFVEGCQAEGALACAKHFPGHGDTATDSHTRLGAVTAPRARLEAVEWPPFKAAIAAGVATVMSAHLALPALGVADEPATLSRAVMTGLLRETLGFGGLVVTDAMLMGGMEAAAEAGEAAVRAIAAGCDMLLMPRDPVATHRALVAAVQAGALDAGRVREAAGRVLAAKARLGAMRAEPPAGGPEALARRVAEASLTRVPTAAASDPPPFAPGALMLAVDDGADPVRLAAWRAATGAEVVDAATPAEAWAALAARAEACGQAIVAVFSPIRHSKERAQLPGSLVAPLRALARRAPTRVVSFASPFVLAQLPEAALALAAYGAHPAQLDAALAALRAGGPYPGALPVAWPEALPDAPEGFGQARLDGRAFA